MVFSSHLFLFYFLPLALACYYALYRAPQRWRNIVLILTGYAFYGWAEPAFMLLMFLTTFVDWIVSLAVAHDDWRLWRVWRAPVGKLEHGGARSSTQKAAIASSIVLNLSVLGFFKYFNFGIDSYNALARALGVESWQWNTLFEVILPLGISFYTFQAMSYTIDVYRGEARAMRSLADFSCFVSMFPHLVAGPILKFSFLSDQIESRSLTSEKCARGVAFLALGFSKKILLANPCGKVADLTFLAGSPGVFDAWYGAVAYAFQIYFDFSAYSDMAIGLGLMLGFVFAKNFDSPYRARSVTDFWRRWHISLSCWLRDYLYVPLGGNRRGTARTYINLILVMLIGGLWHGASWNYVIWGGIHGTMLAAERWHGASGLASRLPHPLRVGLTFLVIVVAWVFFRAKDLPSALAYCQSLAGLENPSAGAALLAGVIFQPYYLGSFLLAGAVVWTAPQTWDWTRSLTLGKAAVLLGLFWIAIVVMTTQSYNPFIYFIF
ncbi:MAG: MBOAT family O-acyltransferase [Verrucomicrobiae bacterium]